MDLPSKFPPLAKCSGPRRSPPVFLPERHPSISKRSFICLCSDVSSKDVQDAVAEGFDHIETLKRYTTATMGPCQGRMCQLSSIAVCARETGRGMGETGTTTRVRQSLRLARRAGRAASPSHPAHAHALPARGVECGVAGHGRLEAPALLSHARLARSNASASQEEYRAVRERVGLIDVSTLGKLEVKGARRGHAAG